MLAFSLANENRTIELTCDDAGIDTLVDVLLRLEGLGTHIHLRAPLLSSVTPWGDPAITEVIFGHAEIRRTLSFSPASPRADPDP